MRKPAQEGGFHREFKSRDSRSYMEVLGKPKTSSDPSMDLGSSSGVKEKVLVVPDRTVAFKELFELALVGRAVNLETLVDFDRLMKIARVEYSRIQYLGGLSILISFKEVVAANKFLDDKDVWGPWFSKLESWRGQSLPLERVAWLKILGVPLHVLKPDILARVGELFGKVLHVPRYLVSDQVLSACRVGILVGENCRIREVVTVKWKDRCYRVWVEEELEDFIPDCLQRLSEDSVVDESSLKSSPIAQVPVNRSMGSEGLREVDSQDRGDDPGGLGFSVDFGNGNNINNSMAADNGFSVPEDESIPEEGGEGSNKIFFFESRKRTRRFRRKASRAQSFGSKSGGGDFLDSSEKGRPIKRTRAQDLDNEVDQFKAQAPVSSDPFSLERLLQQVGKVKDKVAVDQRSASSSRGTFVPSATGIPFDLNDKASSNFSEGSDLRRLADNSPMENGNLEKSSSVDLEVEATVKLGNQLGMELRDVEGIVKNVILGKGINAVPQ
ncbi:hypothetical protein HanPSC8_Chr17g0795381 [Helianthus annuus]|nr:hypothetical protein HanPSC8_Chr17g0795381 [Helianthus annuus]